MFLVLFLIGCSAREETTSPTGQVVLEVENTTNVTIVQEPVQETQPLIPQDPLVSLQEQQLQVYADYNEVRVRIRELENSWKVSEQKSIENQIRRLYHRRDSLIDEIKSLENQIQQIRIDRRAKQGEEELQEVLNNLAREEAELKEKISDNRFRIEKMREAIQQTVSTQVKEDLKQQLEELYSDQENLDNRLQKVHQRMEEHQANLEELKAELEEEKESLLKEKEQKQVLASIAELDRLIREKEETLNAAQSQDEKNKILSKINELAKAKVRLKETLE